ncbi:hypothetical protein B0T21DRAFT_275480, partial [Apiosordaria backusii]
IRDILRQVYRNIRGVSLAASKPSIELNTLFHIRAELQRHKDVISNSSEVITAAEAHLDVFLRFLGEAFKSTDDRLSALLAEGEITYDLLWALFKPNANVY